MDGWSSPTDTTDLALAFLVYPLYIQQVFIQSEVSVETTIKAWGNSLAIRIPAKVAEELGVEENSPVRLELRGNVITIEPIGSRRRGRQRRPLSYYLDRMPDESRDREIGTGPARGRERID